jgi:hypothetical protein
MMYDMSGYANIVVYDSSKMKYVIIDMKSNCQFISVVMFIYLRHYFFKSWKKLELF